MDKMKKNSLDYYDYFCEFDDKDYDKDYDWDYDYYDDYEEDYDKDYDDYDKDYEKKDKKKDRKKDKKKDDKKDDKKDPKKDDKDKKHECKSSTKVRFKACEFCKLVDTEPVDLSKCADRDLKAKIVIKNVCFDRKFKVKVALLDKSGKVIETKTFKAVLRKNKKSHSDKDKGCGTFKKEVKFDLPKNKICHPFDLTIKVSAAYVDKC